MAEKKTPQVETTAVVQTEDVRAVLTNALTKLKPHRTVAVPAVSLRGAGIQVDAKIPDDRPVEFKVSDLRRALAKQ